jgi:hypothetical protein
MKLYAIHAPLTVDAVAGPEGARAARTGFSLAALLFGPLWLLARGLWLALLAYAILAAAAIGLVRAGVLSAEAATALAALGQLYLAVEGRALALAARERAGRPLVDLVHAHSALEAEKIYLDRVLRPVPPAPRRGAPPAPIDVIGLFPEPGR